MGFSSFKHPEYLYQTATNLFIFRMKVPLDCRPFLNKKEVQYSLKTRCVYSARKHIASILPFLQTIFEGMRQGIYTNFPQNALNQTIKNGIHQAIADNLHMYRISPKSPHAAPPPIDDDLSIASPVIPKEAPTPKVTEPTFSDLQTAFFKEKELSQGWRFKTQEDHEAVFALFREVFKDGHTGKPLPISHINKALMRDFKAIIIQLPPNIRKIAKYKNKTIPEIIAMKPVETLSTHTINKYLSRLSNLFTYAVTHGYMTVNPASGLKVKLKSRPDEEREAYSQEDLKKLFRQNPVPSIKPHFYWTPLIALYSGCRLEEVCQLHVDDIKQEDGVWVFDINDKLEKNLKTLSSTRLIPIHPHLVHLGLINYVDTLKAMKEQRLFPDLHQRRDGYGQVISKWFHRHKEQCGIDQGKTFHSFRHTFITHLKHKQVDPFMIHELDGHTVKSETMGRYGKRYTPEILLKEAISRIDYGILCYADSAWEG